MFEKIKVDLFLEKWAESIKEYFMLGLNGTDKEITFT